MFRKLAAECFGTFWLVFGGCGSAVLAAAFPELGIGFAGVALAFGLTVLTMAFAVGHISGGHFNPAVTLGLWAGGRFPAKEVIGYIIAQVVGGIIAAAVLYVVASGKAGFDAAASGFASNGYGEHSPGGFSMLSAIVIEIVLTCGFLLVIHGATDKHAPAGFAPIAIGLALTLRAAPRWQFSRAAGRCSSCGCSGSCQSSAGSSAACCIAPCWKNAINAFQSPGLRAFSFWRQLYSAR